jgi:hypothetical protein
MSSGLLLLSANPDRDHRFLEPGVHYIKLPPSPLPFSDGVRAVLRDPRGASRIADAGSALVREQLDVKVGVSERLGQMGLRASA